MEDRVASTAYQGSHIQSRTYGSPPTPDSPFAAHGATVAIEWRQSDERSDLLTAKGSEFGQIGQQGDTDHWTNTRHTPEQDLLFSPQRAGAYGLAKLFVDVFQAFTQPGDVLLDVGTNAG